MDLRIFSRTGGLPILCNVNSRMEDVYRNDIPVYVLLGGKRRWITAGYRGSYRSICRVKWRRIVLSDGDAAWRTWRNTF